MSVAGRQMRDLIRDYPFTSFYLAMCTWAVFLMLLIQATR